jgi:hypothetical protein
MQDLITAVARLVRAMPHNPIVIEVEQALKVALAAKLVAVTPVAATECQACEKRRGAQKAKMQKYRSKPKLK